jgi:TonB family protein
MKTVLLSLVALFIAACASRSPHEVSFTGDYVDGRKNLPEIAVSVIHREPPRVPASIKKTGLAAYAVIACIIERNGRTTEVQVVRATDDEFGAAARKAVTHWRYAPPLQNGRPVRVAIEIPVTFPFDQ